jgi:ribosomal protein L32
MAIKCPACGEAKARHQVARPDYDPVAPQVIGGIVTALVFALGRKRRFRCDRCGQLYYSHTIGSRIWLAVWVYFCTALALAIALAFATRGRL